MAREGDAHDGFVAASTVVAVNGMSCVKTNIDRSSGGDDLQA